MIKILYFASLRERLDSAGESLDDVPADLATLRRLLAARGGVWTEVFDGGQPVLAAVNQAVAAEGQPIAEGDEVGFFPPVTGG